MCVSERRQKKNTIRIWQKASVGIVLFFFLFTVPAESAVRIKDIAHFKGVRDNQLIGYGLVVGLNGTGDKAQSVFTVKSIASLLSRLGIDVDESEIQPKNVAAVMVTATLPPFIKAGSRIDVTLSSLGDCTSLQGGTLLLTPLQGADKKVYAVAQGPISVGGFEAGSRGGSSGTFGTVARIPQGALIESEVSVTLVEDNRVILSLRENDFTTCVRVAEAINVAFQDEIAEAQDGATIAIRVPGIFHDSVIPFLAKIESINVEVDARAKIVINEKTGTIVGGKNAKISRVMVTHKDISLMIQPQEKKDAKKDKNKKIEVEETTPETFLPGSEALFIEGKEGKKRVVKEEEEVTIGDVAQMLNTLGVLPQDMIAIFQAIKESGAIQADIEII